MKMFEVPAYFPLLSLHLSHVLDAIGLNKRIVRTRRCIILRHEESKNVADQLNMAGEQTKMYCFGSQSEGTTTCGLMSDTDEFFCDVTINAIQEDSEIEDGKFNYLMRNEQTPPGYVQLLVAEQTEGGNIELLPLPNRSIFIKANYAGSKKEKHGPGLKFENPFADIHTDRVGGIKCKSWPVQAQHWLNKRRPPGQWPSQKMLQIAKMSGCFIVPVGHRLSSPENKDVEFRISPSLTERCLVFSFNMTQIKCYVMLKIISKQYLKPATQDGISSFHLKNVMFNIIENTHPKMWKERYLLQCITTGLFVLLEWVRNGYCPNYLIPGENLFAGRITAEEQSKLVHTLEVLIKSKCYFLFEIKSDGIGQILQGKLDLPLEESVTATLYTSVKCSVHLRLQFVFLQLLATNSRMLSEKKYEYGTSAKAVRIALRNALRIIRRLRNSFISATYTLQKAIKDLTPLYCSYLGALMSSIGICRDRAVPLEAMFWFELGTNSDVTSSQLKLASAFFCSEDFNKAAEILADLYKHYKCSFIQPMCGCWIMPQSVDEHLIKKMFANRQASNTLVAHCVKFSRQEFYCVPFALRYEMFKSKGKRHDTYEDRYLDFALVDSLPYLYYLQFITYKQLGKNEHMDCALDKLIDCCTGDYILFHKMTAWNLLGHCMELKQSPDMAIVCYIISLQIRKKDNVAKWLLSLALFKMLRCCPSEL